ncbi:MAG: hypothetical protein KF906_00455 [Actinobacteria bacterium]|nr:hypothetical protein [Actinomycetota bacterium]
MAEAVAVRLTGLPAQAFRTAVTYLEDTLRECQLVLVAPAADPADRVAVDLRRIAAAIVPDLEEIRAVFRSAAVVTEGPVVTLEMHSSPHLAVTLAHLQTHLVQLRFVGRSGGLLVESDPTTSALLTWIWDEAADQLHGRPPRPFPSGIT